MRYIYGLILILVCLKATAVETQENKAVAQLFSDANVIGTFVLYDASANTFIIHNHARANQRFIPASTFKIPNSLIGLSVGVVTNVDEVLPYGGKSQPFKSWQKDMGLRDAIKISNVPIYKELARRIGREQMQEYVAKLQYGNANIGSTVDNFWLQGPLTISAIEQAAFLAKLANGSLPIANEIQSAVREIVLLEQGDAWKLYGKTGVVGAQVPRIGWWVGWVVKDEKIYSFALNIDIHTDADIDKRIPLGRASLKALGIF